MPHLSETLNSMAPRIDSEPVSPQAKSASRRFFDYALVQYVHQRREERINVGVALFDPTARELRIGIDAKAAAARVWRMFPEVDKKGLEFFLSDMNHSLAKDRRFTESSTQHPLLLLADSWANVLQFSQVRTYPAVSMRMASEGLMRRYLTPPAKARPALMGVQKAVENTRIALREVLHLDTDLGQIDTLEIPRIETHLGREVRLQPIAFPFYLYDRFVIDALSFENLDPKDTQREATLFIDKLRALKSFSKQRDVPFEPTATITIDPERADLGLGMIAYIADSAGLSARAIVDADNAKVAVEYIKEKKAEAA
jgi:hypothetical protein